jgi:hypothetical protein
VYFQGKSYLEHTQAKGSGGDMKKALNLVLEEEEIIELIRILVDEDAESALTFLKKHFKGKAREMLEGG